MRVGRDCRYLARVRVYVCNKRSSCAMRTTRENPVIAHVRALNIDKRFSARTWVTSTRYFSSVGGETSEGWNVLDPTKHLTDYTWMVSDYISLSERELVRRALYVWIRIRLAYDYWGGLPPPPTPQSPHPCILTLRGSFLFVLILRGSFLYFLNLRGRGPEREHNDSVPSIISALCHTGLERKRSCPAGLGYRG